TVARLWLIRMFSSAFEGPLGSLKGFISDYRWPVLALSLVVVMATVVFDHKGGRDGITDLATLDEDIASHEHDDETKAGAGEVE
ncbi:MAG: hypothetical protein ABI239_12900, partial [Aquihabitans sp.]